MSCLLSLSPSAWVSKLPSLSVLTQVRESSLSGSFWPLEKPECRMNGSHFSFLPVGDARILDFFFFFSQMCYAVLEKWNMLCRWNATNVSIGLVLLFLALHWPGVLQPLIWLVECSPMQFGCICCCEICVSSRRESLGPPLVPFCRCLLCYLFFWHFSFYLFPWWFWNKATSGSVNFKWLCSWLQCAYWNHPSSGLTTFFILLWGSSRMWVGICYLFLSLPFLRFLTGFMHLGWHHSRKLCFHILLCP